MYCRYCGKNIEDNDRFCMVCGKPTGIQPQADNEQPHSNADYQPDSTAVELVGKNTNYYISQFQKLKWNNKRVSWNWAAFLTGACWLVYRKLYLWALGYIVVNLLLLAEGANIILMVVEGLFANYIYMQHIENLTEEAKKLPENSRTEFIRKKGGTNAVAVIALIVLMVVFIVLVVSAIIAFMNTTMYDPFGYYWWD